MPYEYIQLWKLQFLHIDGYYISQTKNVTVIISLLVQLYESSFLCQSVERFQIIPKICTVSVNITVDISSY